MASSPDSYEVERIMAERQSEDGASEFLIKWKGWAAEDATWEPLEALDNCPAVLRVFRRSGGRIKPTRSTAVWDGPPTPGSSSHRGQSGAAGAASPSSSSCRNAGASADPQPARDVSVSSEPPAKKKPRHAAPEEPAPGTKPSQKAEAAVKRAQKAPDAGQADAAAKPPVPPSAEAPAGASNASEVEAVRKAALKAEKKAAEKRAARAAAKAAAKAAQAEAVAASNIAAAAAAAEAAGKLAAKAASKAAKVTAKAAAQAAARAATVPGTPAAPVPSSPAKKSPKTPPPIKIHGGGGSMRKGKRRRCGVCVGCLTPNCGVCHNCRDMLSQGGSGRCRLACVRRRCADLKPPKQPKHAQRATLHGSCASPHLGGKSPCKRGQVEFHTRQHAVAAPKLVLPETLDVPCPAAACNGTGSPASDAQHVLVCKACGGKWQSSWWYRYLSAAREQAPA
jgi:hypothetical protein